MPKKTLIVSVPKKIAKLRKSQIGTVVSDKMQNTAIVEVAVWKMNQILHKRYQQTTKFMAHNADNQYKSGDIVEITESRPLSKNKSWTITRKIDKKSNIKEQIFDKKAKKD